MQLDYDPLLDGLARAEVRYVLTGSLAAAAYGISVEPRDLDVAPELSPENLARLSGVLREWRAKPHYDPNWPQVTPEDCKSWTAEAPTAENLDHLFETVHGLFDVVPARSGLYEDLVRRAVSTPRTEGSVLVAHPADLLATLRLHKEKHRIRVRSLTSIRDHIQREGAVRTVLPPRSSVHRH